MFRGSINLRSVPVYYQHYGCGMNSPKGRNMDCKLPPTVSVGVAKYCCHHDPQNLQKFKGKK